MNIDWNNKPEWAIGAGYSVAHGWLWFDHSHYMVVNNGSVMYPFNSSFSKDDITNIKLACDNQTKQHDIDWSKKPEWAIGYGILDRTGKAIWFNDEKFMYLNTGDTFKCMNIALNNKIRDIQYPPTKEWGVKELPPVNSKWEHDNGDVYTVVLHANACSEVYEPTIVYRGKNGNIWCIELSGWHKSFKPFKSDKEKWVEAAAIVLSNDNTDVTGMVKNTTMFYGPAGAIYDAMQSGILPTPKGDNIDLEGVAALDALCDAMVSGEQPYKR